MNTGIIVVVLIILWLALSATLFTERKRLMKKYNLELISTTIMGYSFIGFIYLIIKIQNSNGIMNFINSDPNSDNMGPLIGITFWFIVSLIFFFSGDRKKSIKYWLCKFFIGFLISLSFPIFVILSFLGGAASKPKYHGSYGGSSSSYSDATNYSSPSNTDNNSYFIDSLGYGRKIGNDYYDGSRTLRRYGQSFVDGRGIQRNFGESYYDASRTLRSFGDPFVDKSNTLRDFKH